VVQVEEIHGIDLLRSTANLSGLLLRNKLGITLYQRWRCG
jgi:hypothetical protein